MRFFMCNTGYGPVLKAMGIVPMLVLPVLVVLFSGCRMVSPESAGGDEEYRGTETVDTLARRLEQMEKRAKRLQDQVDSGERQLKEARQVRKGLAMREALSEADAAGAPLAWALNDAGLLMASEGQLAAAQLLFERSLKLLETVFDSMHPARGTVLQNLGEVCWQGRNPQAVGCLKESVAVFAASVGEQHPRLASALNALGNVLGECGRMDEAESAYRRAIGIYESQPDGGVPLDLVVPLYNMSVLLLDQDRVADARPLLEKALIVLKHNDALDSPPALVLLRAYSRQLRAAGNEKQALQCDERSAELALKLEMRSKEIVAAAGK